MKNKINTISKLIALIHSFCFLSKSALIIFKPLSIQFFLISCMYLITIVFIYHNLVIPFNLKQYIKTYEKHKEYEKKVFKTKKRFNNMFKYFLLWYQSLKRDNIYMQINKTWLKLFNLIKSSKETWFVNFCNSNIHDSRQAISINNLSYQSSIDGLIYGTNEITAIVY